MVGCRAEQGGYRETRRGGVHGGETSIGGRRYVVSKVCAVPAELGRIGEGDEAVPRRRRAGSFEGEGDGKLRQLTYFVSTHIITI